MANEEKSVNCKNCNGSGTVINRTAEGKPIATTCAVCNGSGSV